MDSGSDSDTSHYAEQYYHCLTNGRLDQNKLKTHLQACYRDLKNVKALLTTLDRRGDLPPIRQPQRHQALTVEEKATIARNVDTFLKDHNISYHSLSLIFSNNPLGWKVPVALKRKLRQYLSRGLVGPSPRAVSAFLSRYGIRNGQFAEAEDATIVEFYNNYEGPNIHSLCGFVLNRFRTAIYKRILRLKFQGIIGPEPNKRYDINIVKQWFR